MGFTHRMEGKELVFGVKMHPAYYQTNIPNAAILARGALDGQLNGLLDTYKLFCELVEKHYRGTNKMEVLKFIAQMFLGGAYETVASFLDSDFLRRREENGRFKMLRKKEPLFEFFHHCRNASFHGNRFKFTGQIYIAQWSGHEITSSDEGNYLFPDKLNMDEVVPLVTDVMRLL